MLDSILLLLHPRSNRTIRWTGLTLSTCLIFSQTELTWSSQGEGQEAGLKSLEPELPNAKCEYSDTGRAALARLKWRSLLSLNMGSGPFDSFQCTMLLFAGSTRNPLREDPLNMVGQGLTCTVYFLGGFTLNTNMPTCRSIAMCDNPRFCFINRPRTSSPFYLN